VSAPDFQSRDPGRDATRRVRELETIAKIASSFTFEQSIEAMMGEVARHVVEGADAAVACVVGATDPATQMATTVLGSFGMPAGFEQRLQGAWRTGGTQIVSTSIQTRRAQVIPLTVVRRPGYEEVLEVILAAGWENMAVVPMIYRGLGIGVLMVVYRPGDEPDEQELLLLEAISDQAAVALENSKLFDQAQSIAVMEERQRISRDLHDSVSQALYAISLGAQTARELLEAGSKAIEPIEYVVSLSDAALAEMRAMIFDLRPEALAQEGLVAALKRQAASIEARHQISVETRFGVEPSLELDAKEMLYRVAQEALHNVVKHARASQVVVGLQEEGGVVTLTVQDNGRGFSVTDEFPGHLGLISMRERASQAGAMVVVTSALGAGCRVTVRLPVPQGDH
jgi:signal transduction histidine kinase